MGVLCPKTDMDNAMIYINSYYHEQIRFNLFSLCTADGDVTIAFFSIAVNIHTSYNV